ncbi:MAG: hypothetical protein ACUVQC_04820 [Thermaceae bacterium]
MTGLFEGIRKDLVETLHREAGLAPGEDPSLSHSVEEALLLATLQNLHLEPELETLARRLKLQEIYRKVLGVADPDGETYQGGLYGTWKGLPRRASWTGGPWGGRT